MRASLLEARRNPNAVNVSVITDKCLGTHQQPSGRPAFVGRVLTRAIASLTMGRRCMCCAQRTDLTLCSTATKR